MADRESSVQIESLGSDGLAVATFTAPSLCEVDKVTAVAEQLRSFVEQNNPRALIFDFSGVKFFSSQVLGLLLDIRGRLTESGGKTAISAIEPQLHRVFKITNLDKIFDFFPDRDSAAAALSASSDNMQTMTGQ